MGSNDLACQICGRIDAEYGLSLGKFFCLDCAEQIHDAYAAAVTSNRVTGRNRRQTAVWRSREFDDRLAAVENRVRAIASVWSLWLNDARRGSISKGTFDAMATLLGLGDQT